MSSKIDPLLERGIEEFIGGDNVIDSLKKGKKLRIKLGIDPTVDTIHIGNAVPLRKLAQFQRSGHKAVFVIGDFTASIGDPAGKNKLRPSLSSAQIKQNVKTYIKQAGKILDTRSAEIHFNRTWFKKMSLSDFIEIAQQFTVAQIIEREDFANRLKDNRDVWLHEIMYPLLQGYDSVKLKIDIELGGTDQKFNMLAGRQLQKRLGLTPQAVMTVPLLVGLDGVKKMSKSLDNFISVTQEPFDMYAKVMSIADEAIVSYFDLATDITEGGLQKIKQELSDKEVNPMTVKKRLAFIITELYHDEQLAEEAQEKWISVFSNRELPKEIETIRLGHKKMTILNILIEAKLVDTKGDGRRLVSQRGVKVDQVVIEDATDEIDLTQEPIITVGKRKVIRVKP